ncbi:MAG: hypothetical protein FWE90_06455 [Defluviitaleaceae bacterium]|nr:hypothetical protein [Defluviitaleaceae bacterium]
MTTQWTQDNKSRREAFNAQLVEAHERAKKAERERRPRPRPRIGTERLSNTDSIRTAQSVRRRLLAKLQEVTGADVDARTRDGMAAEVKLQLDRVDRQIIAIRRRLRAVEEEKKAGRDECFKIRRRRQHDLKERTIRVRHSLLYSAQEGGFDPNRPSDFPSAASNGPAVSYDFGEGNAGMAMDAPDDAASMEMLV